MADITDEFTSWFKKTMRNADGGFDHLPDGLKDDMRLAWNAGRAVGGWQPIESAPKDKSVFLAFDPDDWMTCEGRWQNGAWVIAATFYDPNRSPPFAYRETRVTNRQPTHWQPSPLLPPV